MSSARVHHCYSLGGHGRCAQCQRGITDMMLTLQSPLVYCVQPPSVCTQSSDTLAISVALKPTPDMRHKLERYLLPQQEVGRGHGLVLSNGSFCNMCVQCTPVVFKPHLCVPHVPHCQHHMLTHVRSVLLDALSDRQAPPRPSRRSVWIQTARCSSKCCCWSGCSSLLVLTTTTLLP